MSRPSEVTGFPGEHVLARTDFCVVTYDCDPGVLFDVPGAVAGSPKQIDLAAMARLLAERHAAIRPHTVSALADLGLAVPDVVEIRITEVDADAEVDARSAVPLVGVNPQQMFNTFAEMNPGKTVTSELLDECVESTLAHEETHVAMNQRPAAVRTAIDLNQYAIDIDAAFKAGLGLGLGQRWDGGDLGRINFARKALDRQLPGYGALAEGIADSASATAMRDRRAAKGDSQTPGIRFAHYETHREFVDHVIAAGGPLAVIDALELPLSQRHKLPTESEWHGGDLGAEAWLGRLGWLPDNYVPVLDRPRPSRSKSEAGAPPRRIAAAAQQQTAGSRGTPPRGPIR